MGKVWRDFSRKKIAIGLAIFVLLIILLAIFVLTMGENIRQQYLAGKVLREQATLERAYKNDNYGSTTPEGTLELFIEALKKGDAEMASNYFVPEKKEEYRKMINEWKENNRIGYVIGLLQNPSKSKETVTSLASVTFAVEGKAGLIFRFFKNEYSQKWLIESL